MTLIKLNLLCPRPSRLFSLELRVATSAPRGGRTGMTTSNVPEAALTPEQWRLVETLAQSVTPSQARWLGGYFTGLETGLRSSPSQTVPPMQSAGRTLTILHGTEKIGRAPCRDRECRSVYISVGPESIK